MGKLVAEVNFADGMSRHELMEVLADMLYEPDEVLWDSAESHSQESEIFGLPEKKVRFRYDLVTGDDSSAWDDFAGFTVSSHSEKSNDADENVTNESLGNDNRGVDDKDVNRRGFDDGSVLRVDD